jgi:hypothetical protein
MEVSCELQALTSLTGGKKLQYPLDRRLGGPQSRSGRGGNYKKFRTLPGIKPPTELPRLKVKYVTCILYPLAYAHINWILCHFLLETGT